MGHEAILVRGKPKVIRVAGLRVSLRRSVGGGPGGRVRGSLNRLYQATHWG